MLIKPLGKGFLPLAILFFLILWASLPAAAAPALPNQIDPEDCTFSHTITQPYYVLSEVYRIPVVVHVISNTSDEGNLTDQQVIDQIQVLNEDFRALATDSTGEDTKIEFNLLRITRTVDDVWFNGYVEEQYMAALVWDPARFLNIYINAAGGEEGKVNDPLEQAGYYRDGVTLAWYLVGGRDQDNGYTTRNQGRTAVHFVGKYLGLLETYTEGCMEVGDSPDDSGDLIPDTNAQEVPGTTCDPVTSCGDADPVNNFLNSTPDNCRTEFTSDQANRMVCFLLNYRPGLYKPGYYGLPILNGPMMPLLSFP